MLSQRYDHSWYGPVGDSRTDARAIVASKAGIPGRQVIAERQRSGAVVYRAGADDPAEVAIWIPGGLCPGGHHADVDAWLDPA